MRKPIIYKNIKLHQIVGGGQVISELPSGKKVFVWGGLPDEVVDIEIIKSKSSHAEAIVTKVVEASNERIEPKDHVSYLSTSPWQIMSFEAEQKYKSELIKDAFKLHNIDIETPELYSDNKIYNYRNKMEYSFWWDEVKDEVNLAFFKRGTHTRIQIEESSLPTISITEASKKALKLIRAKKIDSRNIKTLMIRSSREGSVAMQLYVKDENFENFNQSDFDNLQVQGLEIIYSNPKSPASVITKRLQSFGLMTLHDLILSTSFDYSVDGFFQVNLPVYETALIDMKDLLDHSLPTVDMYSGVGTIGLTIGTKPLSLVEVNESAVGEMKKNIEKLEREDEAKAVLLPAEKALEEITSNINLILDPPRAGCHDNLIQRILEVKPKRIIYLSCNPVTQARDIEKLSEQYKIEFMRGYNFFPRTPHIENLVLLSSKN